MNGLIIKTLSSVNAALAAVPLAGPPGPKSRSLAVEKADSRRGSDAALPCEEARLASGLGAEYAFIGIWYCPAALESESNIEVDFFSLTPIGELGLPDIF